MLHLSDTFDMYTDPESLFYKVYSHHYHVVLVQEGSVSRYKEDHIPAMAPEVDVETSILT